MSISYTSQLNYTIFDIFKQEKNYLSHKTSDKTFNHSQNINILYIQIQPTLYL